MSTDRPRYDQITQVRLTRDQMSALRLEAAEREDSIGATVRSIVVSELARLHPELDLVDADERRDALDLGTDPFRAGDEERPSE